MTSGRTDFRLIFREIALGQEERKERARELRLVQCKHKLSLDGVGEVEEVALEAFAFLSFGVLVLVSARVKPSPRVCGGPRHSIHLGVLVMVYKIVSKFKFVIVLLGEAMDYNNYVLALPLNRTDPVQPADAAALYCLVNAHHLGVFLLDE